MIEFLEPEKVPVLPDPPFSPDMAPSDYSLFPTLKNHLTGKRYNARNALGSAVVYQYLSSLPIEECENASKSGLIVKKGVFRYMESVLKGRASQNDFNICNKGETMKVILFLEQSSYDSIYRFA